MGQKPIKSSNKKLFITLWAFIGLIVLLAGGIIIATLIKNNRGEEVVGCEGLADEYEMRVCLSHEEPGQELNERYDAMLQKSFDDENYELFNDLIMDRSSDLILDDDCRSSLKWIASVEKKYAESLPILDLYGLYVNGYNAATECDNTDRVAYYQGKMNETMDSAEYASAVAEDDYRVIGDDIMNEDEDGFIDEGDEYEE